MISPGRLSPPLTSRRCRMVRVSAVGPLAGGLQPHQPVDVVQLPAPCIVTVSPGQTSPAGVTCASCAGPHLAPLLAGGGAPGPGQAEGGGYGALLQGGVAPLQPGHPAGAAALPPRRRLAVPHPHPGRPTVVTTSYSGPCTCSPHLNLYHPSSSPLSQW